MSFRIMTGNRAIVRAGVIAALVLCLFLGGCSGKMDSGEVATGNETVGNFAAESTEITEATNEEETQISTTPLDNTVPDEKPVSEDAVLSTESTETPADSSAATIPENKESSTPDYGIELPDDNWD